ncbi:hypothetical protein JCM10207_005026 [Rhodosporidiobolus poonsookiae]
MLRDTFLNRLFVRSSIAALDAVAPLCTLYALAALATHPAPPAIAFTTHLPLDQAVDLILRLDYPLHLFLVYCCAEALWYILSLIGRIFLDRRWWDARDDGLEAVNSEERWRLWRSMVESTQDPWEWLGGFFTAPGHKRAPRGASDPALQRVKMDSVGRRNVEEFIAHFMFSARLRDLKRRPKSVDLAELHSMILLLEAQITLSRLAKNKNAQPFRFLRGRSPHRVFRLSEEPLNLGHHPLLFYACIQLAAQTCNLALYCAGFRYYGGSAWPYPFLRTSRSSLESLHDPIEAEKMRDPRLAQRVGYWFKPATGKAKEEDERPIVFCHGISGIFTVTPFLLSLTRMTGRAVFIPTLPYISMRLSPPSSILTRLEYVAAARRMLWRHGFGLTSLDPTEDDESFAGDDSDEEDWRRAKAVIVAHSFGAGAAGWLLRDAPDIVAGTVLIDPMSFFLFSAETPRNFFRTKCKTAGEIFFRYFALERGINHFLSRHLRWSDSALFPPRPAAPLPPRVVDALVPRCARDEKGPDEVPFYAPWVSPCPEGPIPTVVFLSERDCILPIARIRAALQSSGFSTSSPPPPYSPSAVAKSPFSHGKTGAPAAAEAEPPVAPLQVMAGLEHGAVMVSRRWYKEIGRAIEAVASAAERWENDEDEESEEEENGRGEVEEL